MSEQTEFSFAKSQDDQACNQWLTARRVALEELARRLNPPAARSHLHDGSGQAELSFAKSLGEQGYSRWLAGRRIAAQELGRRLHLPLGREVEVWLSGGIRLRGKLELQEEILFIEEDRVRQMGLVVDHVAFTYREMESCVRLD